MKRVIKTSIFTLGLFMFLFLLNTNSNIKAEESWGYAQTHMDDFLDQLDRDTNEDIVVALIDTGIDPNHSWFKAKDGSSRIVGGSFCDETGCTDETYDDGVLNYLDTSSNGHGTHIAGIIAKITPDNVKFLPIKVHTTIQGDFSGDAVIKALIHVNELTKEYNIKVVNFGFARNSVNECDLFESITYNHLAIDPLYRKGILVVAPAGNTGGTDKASCLNGLTGVITVSSIDKHYQIANNSSYGSSVDFAAPGVDIYSAKNNSDENATHSLSGTSQATGHISANIALLYADCPTCDAETIELALQKSAQVIGEKDKYGHGFIDMSIAHDALEEAIKEINALKVAKETQIKVNICFSGPGTITLPKHLFYKESTTKMGFSRKKCYQFYADKNDTVTFNPNFLSSIKTVKVDGYNIARPLFAKQTYVLTKQVNIEVKFGFLYIF